LMELTFQVAIFIYVISAQGECGLNKCIRPDKGNSRHATKWN